MRDDLNGFSRRKGYRELARPRRRGDRVKRREFITVLAGAAAWPLMAYAQQPERMRRVGVLMAYAQNDPFTQAGVTAFVQALGRFGWVEGKNIWIDYRFAAGDPRLFKTFASELVGLMPDAIVASNTPALAALREQTRTIPIVFAVVSYPVEQGFVQSLARPGGNITGFSAYDAPIMGKWLQLLKEVAPGVKWVTVMFNPDTAPYGALFYSSIEAAAPPLGVTVTAAPIHDDAGIEEAIAAQARVPGSGLIILPDSFNATHRDAIIAAATRHSLPLIGLDTFPSDGGLMSYTTDTVDLHAQAASYVDRILRGANPADLPVQRPTKYSLVINLKTAKALGLTVPPGMLQLADEVIE
jgi:putative tryptophan/tyrosine transport system substrate-binding protein